MNLNKPAASIPAYTRTPVPESFVRADAVRAQHAAVSPRRTHFQMRTYIFCAVARETGDATARTVQQRSISDVEQVRPRHILSDSIHLTKQAAGRPGQQTFSNVL